MNQYEVFNAQSAHSFGVYEANSQEEAIEAACKDAGYASKAEAEAVMGQESALIATQQESA